MVPQIAQAGFDNIDVMVPKAAVPNVVFGSANAGWLSTLKASIPSSLVTRPNYVILTNDMSMLKYPKPRMMLRPAEP